MAHPERQAQLARFISLQTSAKKTPSGPEPVDAALKLKAVTMRHEQTVQQVLGVFEPDATVVWRTFLVPSEIIYASGARPLTPEVMGAALCRNQAGISRTIERAEENGYDPKQCSFLKCTIGGCHEGLLPTPDVAVGSMSFCNGIGPVLQDVAALYHRPFFFLNLPQYNRSLADIDYVAEQLKQLVRVLCEHTGVDPEEVDRTRLPQAIEYSNQASALWGEVLELRRAKPSPLSGREALDFATVLSQSWGLPETVEIYRTLRNEVRERVDHGVGAVPHEAVRLGWLHLRPYYSSDLMRVLEAAGAAVVMEEVNFSARLPMDPTDPYTSLAREILVNGGRYRNFTGEWKDELRKAARNFDADGVVHFGHDHCVWVESVFPPMQRFIRDELGLPLLSLSGDCLIKGRENLLHTRVQAFVEGLLARKRGNGAGLVSDPVTAYTSSDGKGRTVVGIDVGSATVKVVALDGARQIVGASVRATGADNQRSVRNALNDALEQAGGVPLDQVAHIVATGVGRTNVPVDHETVTEITCHKRGVVHLVPDARSVIDIGGQDTKAILVQEGVARLNDSCAAGTGKFLEAIARALEIDLDQLGTVDADAREAVAIHKMCTVFAESEVVDRVAAGSDVAAIVRGVHEMVASKAATLLKRLSGDVVFPVVFSGGVARNAGVVRALQRCVGDDVIVPQQSQLVGALGAALIAADHVTAAAEARAQEEGLATS
jgi:predicted CoA-substrate-specific enzyme activase